MNRDVRAGIMRRFSNGHTQVLVNVDVATEGFDVPDVSCILMLRPTQSWGLYAQMAGRGVRPLPGTVDNKNSAPHRRIGLRDSDKPDCIVIDVVDLAGKFNLVAPEERDNDEKKIIAGPAGVAGLVGLPAVGGIDGTAGAVGWRRGICGGGVGGSGVGGRLGWYVGRLVVGRRLVV